MPIAIGMCLVVHLNEKHADYHRRPSITEQNMSYLNTHKTVWALAVATVLTSTACVEPDEGDNDEPTEEQAVEEGLGADSDIEVVAATHHESTLAESADLGPGIAEFLAGSDTIIPGGSLILIGTVEADATHALIGVSGESGYWSVPVDENGAFSATILVGQEVANDTMTLLVGAQNAAAWIGPVSELSLRVQSVGTGDLQVSLSWDALADVDLHLIEPTGSEIWYGHRNSFMTGGQLDLDSNPACSIDGVNNENITYGDSTPTAGHYIVRVDLYEACDEPDINWSVVVRVDGDVIGTVEGSFVESDQDMGGARSGMTVFEFDLE